MKKYFEYPFDEEVKKKILDFYEDVTVDMHTSQTELKTKIKLERIFKQIDFKETDIVLDVGCSTGELFHHIHSMIKEGIGIDLSKNIIDLNISKNQYKNVKYELFDGEHISLPTKVNKVCLLDVLEHAFCPEALIKSVYDSLVEGGELILEVPTTGWLSELVFGKYHMGHLRYYDPESIKSFLQKHNFLLQNIHVYNSVPLGAYMLKKGDKLYRVLNSLCNLVPPKLYPYYGAIIVICKKR